MPTTGPPDLWDELRAWAAREFGRGPAVPHRRHRWRLRGTRGLAVGVSWRDPHAAEAIVTFVLMTAGDWSCRQAGEYLGVHPSTAARRRRKGERLLAGRRAAGWSGPDAEAELRAILLGGGGGGRPAPNVARGDWPRRCRP